MSSTHLTFNYVCRYWGLSDTDFFLSVADVMVHVETLNDFGLHASFLSDWVEVLLCNDDMDKSFVKNDFIDVET